MKVVRTTAAAGAALLGVAPVDGRWRDATSGGDGSCVPTTRRTAATVAELSAAFGRTPFTVEQAGEAGVSRGRLRAAESAGGLRRLRRGVLVVGDALAAAETPEARHLLQAEALVRRLDGVAPRPSRPWALSHATAVTGHGLPFPGLWTPESWPVDLTSASRSLPAADGWRRHSAALPEGHMTVVGGLPVTTVSRTAVDIAVSMALQDSLPVVDAALRRLTRVAVRVDSTGAAQGLGERDLVRDPRVVAAVRLVLVRILDETGRRQRRARAVRAIEAANPAAENGFESVSRARLLLGGVPTPEVGYPVRGDDGRTYWADLAWPELRVLGEADGRGKYTGPQVLYAEKRRQEALERAGWIVVRWTWDELFRTPEVVVARVLAALDRAAARAA